MSRIAKISVSLNLMLAVCVGSWACSPGTKPTLIATTPPIKSYEASDLVGLWLLDQVGDDTLISFHADGTYARDAGGQLVTEPATFGTYTVNGTHLIFNVQVDECPSAGQYIWEINIPEDGLLTSVVLEDTTCYGLQESNPPGTDCPLIATWNYQHHPQ